MFVCLFVCLLTCLFFYFNHLGTPTGIYPENFVKIGLDLAEIYRILKKCLFVYLFVCLFIDLFVFCFNLFGTPTEISPENFVEIRYFNHLGTPTEIYHEKFHEDPTRFGWDIQDLKHVYFVCLFVCLFMDLFFLVLIIAVHPKELFLEVLWWSTMIWLRYLGF